MSDHSEDQATLILARAIENLARAIAELASKLPHGIKVTVTQAQAGGRPMGPPGNGGTL